MYLVVSVEDKDTRVEMLGMTPTLSLGRFYIFRLEKESDFDIIAGGVLNGLFQDIDNPTDLAYKSVLADYIFKSRLLLDDKLDTTTVWALDMSNSVTVRGVPKLHIEGLYSNRENEEPEFYLEIYTDGDTGVVLPNGKIPTEFIYGDNYIMAVYKDEIDRLKTDMQSSRFLGMSESVNEILSYRYKELDFTKDNNLENGNYSVGVFKTLMIVNMIKIIKGDSNEDKLW